jgi:hypothetical protein
MRRLNLVDAMTLVAAIAIGLSVVVWMGMASEGIALAISSLADRSWRYTYRGSLGALLALSPIPAMLAVALLALRVRSPRPIPRVLGRQPGFLAGVAVLLASTVVLGNLMIATVATWGHHGWKVSAPYSTWVQASVTTLPAACGYSVAMAWMTLVLGGRWRPEPSWIDRAGRILGTYWLVAGLGLQWTHFVLMLA